MIVQVSVILTRTIYGDVSVSCQTDVGWSNGLSTVS